MHFSERVGSRYLNPLRAGAMGPYVDVKAPRIGGVTFERAGNDLGHVLSGRVDVVVEAFDTPALAVPAPWNKVRLTPALVRWRVIRRGNTRGGAGRWPSMSAEHCRRDSFSAVFAGGTRQNRTYRVGRYRFYLRATGTRPACGWLVQSWKCPSSDIRGNATASSSLRGREPLSGE